MVSYPRRLVILLLCLGAPLGCGDSDEGIARGDPGVCDDCHAVPPSSGRHGKHEGEGVDCNGCHACVVGDLLAIIDEAAHNNQTNNVCGQLSWMPATGRCSNIACHGDESW